MQTGVAVLALAGLLISASCGGGTGQVVSPLPAASSSSGGDSGSGGSGSGVGLDASSFGAKGDGRTDDTASLRAALRAASRRAAALVLRPGVYEVSGGLTLPAGVSIRTAGGTAWLRGVVTVGSAATYTRLHLGSDNTSSCIIPEGTHDLVFVKCLFTAGQRTRDGVLSLTEPCHDITFRDCTIGQGQTNGMTIVDKGGTIHDISVEGCTFRSSSRMGFECISRGSTTAIYRNIDLVGCTFEPQGSEAISFDGPALPADCLVADVLIKGAGENRAYPWGAGFEINGPSGFTVRRLVIERTRGSMLNLNCGAARSGWTFTDCTFDYTRGVKTTATDADARTISASGMNGAVFTRCTFNAGEAAFNNGWLRDCADNDFRTCAFLGTGTRAELSLVGDSPGNLLP